MSHPARCAGLKRGDRAAHPSQAILCPHPVGSARWGRGKISLDREYAVLYFRGRCPRCCTDHGPVMFRVAGDMSESSNAHASHPLGLSHNRLSNALGVMQTEGSWAVFGVHLPPRAQRAPAVRPLRSACGVVLVLCRPSMPLALASGPTAAFASLGSCP